MSSEIRQLLSSCEGGDVQTVESLLDQGIDVDSADNEGVTALQVACANGHEQMVKALLMRGAGVNICNDAGWTPSMQAARYGHAGVFLILVQNSADINARTRLDIDALTLASRGGFTQVVRILLEVGADLYGSRSLYEYTPLLAAALNGHDAVLRLLLDRGSDVNYQTASAGLSPLMLAALNGHMTTAQILIEHGCGANVVSAAGKTALDIATERGKWEVKGYLDRKTQLRTKSEPEDVQPDIIESTKHGDIQQIREILEVDPLQRDASSPQDGATPLMFAAMTGRLDIAQLLVEWRCDMDKQDAISGWTALMQATYHGKKSVVTFLVNIGADVTIQARNGCTAFDMASLIDDVDTEMLRLLASRTLQVNRTEKGKKSWAKQNGAASLMSLDSHLSDEQKSGFKGWWSRMSNRFRNLKLGRTFNLSTNRLSVFSSEIDDDVAIKGGVVSEQLHSTMDASTREGSGSVLPLSHAPDITSYDTMLLETKKSAAMYTLVKNWDKNRPHADVMGSETLKPVIPPFLPLPSFGLDDDERAKLTNSPLRPRGLDGSSSMTLRSSRPLQSSKFLQTASPGFPGSPFISSRYRPGVNISPTSSGGASGVGGVHKSAGLHHNSLFDIGYQSSMHSNTAFMPRNKPSKPRILDKSNTTSPNSSTSGSSSLTPQRSSHGKSTSSKDSTASTLTPSPSPLPKDVKKNPQPIDHSQNNKTDELADILRVLSLERYQPIFEEQEVDMEAFLTLTDGDLRELGIGQVDSRRQILSTITELSSGKGRERRHIHDTMLSFQNSLHTKHTHSQFDTESSLQNSGGTSADARAISSKSRAS